MGTTQEIYVRTYIFRNKYNIYDKEINIISRVQTLILNI